VSESDGGTSSDHNSVPSVHTAASDSELPVPAAEDEEIVNMAINSFLMAIQSKFHDQSLQWSVARDPFREINFGRKIMTARTDGFLKATNSSKIFAIIEAKADVRSRQAKPQVFWQETAEMVAWLMYDEKQGHKDHR
jgi:hypothetical protein